MNSSNVSAAAAGDDAYEFSPEWQFHLFQVVYGYIVPVICVVGFIGNLINLLVLASWRNNVIIRYLVWMSAADTCVLLLVMTYCAEFGWAGARHARRSLHAARYYYQAVYVLISTASNTSISIVTIITVERFLAICCPLKAKAFSAGRNPTALLLVAVLLAFALSILSAFEYDVVEKVSETNATSNGSTPLEANMTHSRFVYLDVNATSTGSIPLGANGSTVTYTRLYNPAVFGRPWYRVYTYAHALLYYIVCIVLVAILNAVIAVQYRRSLRRRRTLHEDPRGRGPPSQERALYTMLAAAVLVYTCCLAPTAVKFLLDTHQNLRTNWFQVFTAIANTLEVANSALNFYLYTASSSEFRNHCRKMLSKLFICQLQQYSGTDNQYAPNHQMKQGPFRYSIIAKRRCYNTNGSVVESAV